MKQLNFLLILLIGVAFLTTSCDDDFSEEDLLNAQFARQDTLRSKNIEALNQAGIFVSLQLKVVDTDGSGVGGLEVSLASSVIDGSLSSQATTTDAAGVAVFSQVPVGGNIINVSGGGIMPVTLYSDFGTIDQGEHYTVLNDGTIVPTPVTESAIITVLGAATATGTIQGTVQIETDLTNAAPEVPQDLTIKAEFNDGLSNEATFNLDYFFSTSGNELGLGEGTVDNATGAYSINVPANVNFNIVVPNVSYTQRMAVGSVSGVELEVPEYQDVDANFGPSYGTSAIPFVRGARIVFDDPAGGAGSGFTLSNFARVPRDRFDGGFTASTNFPADRGSEVFTFSTLGSGYTSSPTVTITDATGENIYAEAHVEYAITGLAVGTAGTGFTDGVSYGFDIIYDEVFDNGDGTTDVNTDVVYSFNALFVEADVSGGFIGADVQAALDDAIADEDFFFDPADLETISDNVTNLRLVSNDGVTDAVLNISSAVGQVAALRYNGDNFTNPTFAFSGGGGATQAAVEVVWASQWSFDLDNSNSSGYVILPDIGFEINPADQDPDRYYNDDVEVYDVNGGQVANNSNLTNFLEVEGGQIVSEDPTHSYRTDDFSATMPIPLVENSGSPETASATVNINSEGQITSIFSIDEGSGYLDAFGATIEPGAAGAPGSGATIVLFGGFQDGGEFFWESDYIIQDQGSDYLQELNVINDNGGTRGFTDGDNTNSVDEGAVYQFNIDYGTGFRAVTYGGTN